MDPKMHFWMSMCHNAARKNLLQQRKPCCKRGINAAKETLLWEEDNAAREAVVQKKDNAARENPLREEDNAARENPLIYN